MKKLIISIFFISIIVFAGQKVYITPSGKKYHTNRNCKTLGRSKVVHIIDISKVTGRGLCKVCKK